MLSKYFKLDPFNLFTSPSKGEKIIWIVAIVLALPTRPHVGFMGAAVNALLYGLIMIWVYRFFKNRTCKYDVDGMSFSHRLVNIRANKASNKVSINSGKFHYEGRPQNLSFYYHEKIKVRAYTPTVTGYTSSGERFTGQGGAPVVYNDTIGWTVTISDMSNKNKVVLELKNDVARKMRMVTDRIEAWRKEIDRKDLADITEMVKLETQQKAEEASKKASEQAEQYLKDWGLHGENPFIRYYYSNDGSITEMLAALSDGRGGAVYNGGKNFWSGSWKNAVVNEVNDTLEIQVDDPDYRSKHLKEHRFVIPSGWKREQRLEWFDRIRILSAQAQP